MKLYNLYNKFKSCKLNIPKFCNGYFVISSFDDDKVIYKSPNSKRLNIEFELSNECKLIVSDSTNTFTIPYNKDTDEFVILKTVQHIRRLYKNTPLDEIINSL